MIRRGGVMLVAAAAVAGPVEVVRADEGDADAWYGWQTLMSDLGSVSLASVGARHDRPGTFVWLAAGTWLVGPPLIHLAHEQPDHALASFGLRLGGPLAGGFVGTLVGAAGSSDDGGRLQAAFGGALGGALGAILGAVAASVIDWTVLSREPGQSSPGFVLTTAF